MHASVKNILHCIVLCTCFRNSLAIMYWFGWWGETHVFRSDIKNVSTPRACRVIRVARKQKQGIQLQLLRLPSVRF
uniref:Uncharacterized protein n=1 Tax=Aegilops tauschii subsp. strangulata TaxID=200361 RepID=A0A453C8W9_AEGTS